MKRIVTASLLLCLFSADAFADLQLNTKIVEIKARPADETVSTIFTFTNKGSKTIRITGIESKCSCLSATLDAASYAAGAKGVGTAEFKVGSFSGRYEKFVVVTTDDPDQEEWVITFVLDVPEVIQIEPRTLQWWIGDAADEKSATLKVVGDDPIRVKNITSTKPNVKFAWEEIKPGREYRIKAKPDSTAEVSLGALKIETDSKIPKYQRQLAFVSIFRRSGSVAAGQQQAQK